MRSPARPLALLCAAAVLLPACGTASSQPGAGGDPPDVPTSALATRLSASCAREVHALSAGVARARLRVARARRAAERLSAPVTRLERQGRGRRRALRARERALKASKRRLDVFERAHPERTLEPAAFRVYTGLYGAYRARLHAYDAVLEPYNAQVASLNRLVQRRRRLVARENRLVRSVNAGTRRYHGRLTGCLAGVKRWDALVSSLERRLAEAARGAGAATVEVSCDAAAAWKGRGAAGEPGYTEEGYVVAGERVIHLSPDTCFALARLLSAHPPPLACIASDVSAPTGLCSPASADVVSSVVTLAHEDQHANGIDDEARAQCSALQLVNRVAARLGMALPTRNLLGRFELKRYVVPPRYRSSRCRKGGALDVDPQSPFWSRRAAPRARRRTVADVFVSYSRTDQPFVRELHDALLQRGREAWVDWEDIPPTARWLDTIFAAIDEADAFVFVISRRSLGSRVCAGELAHAVDGGKRLIPVLREDVERDLLPDSLASLQWIDARTEVPLAVVVAAVARALDVDVDWVRLHTRLLAQAREWEQSGRRRGRLLRRADLRAAEAWVSAAPAVGDVRPTTLQLTYIQASRRASTRSVTTFAAVAIAVAVVSVALAVVALRERDSAQRASRLALSRELSAGAVSQLDVDPELAVLLARRAAGVSPTPEAVLALRRALAADRLETALRPNGGYTAIALSPDGRYAIATAAAQGLGPFPPARLLDARSGRTLRLLTDHGLYIQDAEFAPAGDVVLTYSFHDARVWSLPGGRLISEVPGFPAYWFTPDGTRVATNDNDQASVWDARSGRLVARLGAITPGRSGYAFDPTGSRAAATDSRNVAYVWDTRTARLLRVLHGPTEASRQLYLTAFSPGGLVMATASTDGGVQVWRGLTGAPLVLTPAAHSERQSNGGAAAIAFSPDGSRVAAAYADGSACIWRVRDGALLVDLPKTSRYSDIQFSPDGRRLVTASSDGTARVFDARSGTQLLVLRGHSDGVLWARFDASGRRVFSAGAGDVRSWNVAPPQVTYVRGMSGDVHAQFAPDGRTIVASDFDTTRLFSLAGKLLVRLTGHIPNDGAIAAISASGRYLASIASDGRVLLYARPTRWRPRRLHFAGDNQAVAVQFSADERRLLAVFVGRSDLYEIPGGRRVAAIPGFLDAEDADLSEALLVGDKSIDVVDLPSGEKRHTLPGGRPIALSPDGRLAATTLTTHVYVSDATTGRLRYTLEAPANVRSVIFSSDGARLLTTQADGSVGLWTAANGRQNALLVSPSLFATAAAFNADASLVAVGGDATVQVFDAATGFRLAEFASGGGRDLSSLSFGGEGDATILVGNAQSGNFAVVPCEICLPPAALERLADRRVTRGFTRTERQRFLHQR